MRHSRLVSTVLLVAAVLACGPPLAAQKARPRPPAHVTATPVKPATPKKEMAVPFAAGETLTYDVSWSSYLTAGTATVRVMDKKPSYGSVAYYVVAEGRPTTLLSKLYSVYYKVDSLLDAYTLLPQRGSVYSEEGKRHRMKTTLFDQAKRRAEYQVETRTVVKQSLAVPPFVQDPLGALYVLRSIPLKAGEKMTMPICDGGKSYRVTIEAGGMESVRAAGQTSQAQRFTVKGPPESGLGGKGVSLWLSADARRVPLKMQADLPVGTFVLTLTAGH